MPGKSWVIDRGNLQKVHIDPPPTPRTVSVLRNNNASEVLVTTSHNVDCSSPKALAGYQLELEKLKAVEEAKEVEAALPLLQRIEGGATIRDRVMEEHARLPNIDLQTDSGVYVPQPQADYWEAELAGFLSQHCSVQEQKDESCAFWAELVDTAYRELDQDTVNDIHAFHSAFGLYPDLLLPLHLLPLLPLLRRYLQNPSVPRYSLLRPALLVTSMPAPR